MPKPHRISSAAQLDDAMKALIAADIRLEAVIAALKEKPKFVPRRKHGFEALVDILQTLEKYWFEIVELPPEREV